VTCDSCGKVVIMPFGTWFPYPWFCDACKLAPVEVKLPVRLKG
jgi:hypothetical protein